MEQGKQNQGAAKSSGQRKFLGTRAGKWTLGAVIIFVLAIIGSFGGDKSQTDQNTTSIAVTTNSTTNATNTTAQSVSEAKVVSVVDGDTVDLEDGTRVRVVGIDTPETVDPRKPVQCFGIEASKKMKELLTGKTVTLAKSVIGDSVDKYGRQLYYITLENVDIGAKMIEDGYAYAYTSYPHDRNDAYVALQQQAKSAKRGLWADATCSGNANTNTTTQTANTNSPAPNNTNTTVTNTQPAPTPAASCNCTNDLDCSDFASHAAAQEVYNCCKEKVGYDFHKLDGNDNDGLACESLP